MIYAALLAWCREPCVVRAPATVLWRDALTDQRVVGFYHDENGHFHVTIKVKKR